MAARMMQPMRWLAAVAITVALGLGAAAAQDGAQTDATGTPQAPEPAVEGGGPETPASDAVVTRESPGTDAQPAPSVGDLLRTGSPRQTIATFLRLAAEMEARLDSYAQVKSAFTARRVAAIITEVLEIVDISEVPPASRRDAANDTLALLMDIFGRIEPVDLDRVSGVDAFPDEGPAAWRVPGTPLRIVRMTEGPKQGEFVFGPPTPDVAARFFPRIEHLPLRKETDLPVRSWTHTFPQWTGLMIPAGTAAAMPPLLRAFALDTPIWKIIAIVIVTAVLAAGIGLVHWLVAGPGGRSALAILRRTVTPVLMLAAVAWMGPFLQFQPDP